MTKNAKYATKPKSPEPNLLTLIADGYDPNAEPAPTGPSTCKNCGDPLGPVDPTDGHQRSITSGLWSCNHTDTWHEAGQPPQTVSTVYKPGDLVIRVLDPATGDEGGVKPGTLGTILDKPGKGRKVWVKNHAGGAEQLWMLKYVKKA